MNKKLLVTAIAIALGVGTNAWAGEPDNKHEESPTVIKTSDSFNKTIDKDTKVTVTKNDNDTKTTKDSFNKDTKVTVTKNDNDTAKDSFNKKVTINDNDTKNKDSYNTKTKDSYNTKTKDSYNTTKKHDNHSTNDSFNTSDSFNHDSSINVKDVRVAIATSVLNGAVSGNSVKMGQKKYDYTAKNSIDDGSFSNVKGISTAAQNSGQNSLIQQNYTIQANVNNSK